MCLSACLTQWCLMLSEFWTSTSSTRNSGRSGFKFGMRSTRGWWGNCWDLHRRFISTLSPNIEHIPVMCHFKMWCSEPKWRPHCVLMSPQQFSDLYQVLRVKDTCGLLTERNPWWSIWRSLKTSKCTESTTSTSRIRKEQSCGWEWTRWGSTFMNRMTSKRLHSK